MRWSGPNWNVTASRRTSTASWLVCCGRRTAHFPERDGGETRHTMSACLADGPSTAMKGAGRSFNRYAHRYDASDR